MILFSYGFGMAIGFALAFAVGNSWVREHRDGKWTQKHAIMISVTAVALGLAIGWGLADYLQFTDLFSTHKMPMGI